MEFDLEDPLTSFEEHNSDTIPDLLASESDHMPSRHSLARLRNSDFYVSFRKEAVSLILQAQFSCNFEPFMSYLALNYLDRYVSKQEIPLGKPWVSRLLVIACLSLAAKMKNSPFSLSDIQRGDGFAFDAQAVHKMELLILDALSWRMRSITPLSFFSFFVSFLGTNENDDAQLMQQPLKDRASEIIFTSQTDIKFLEFKPSIMAASALLCATHELFPSQFACLKASFSACQYVKSENLWKCYNLMQENILMMMMKEYGPNSDTVITRTSMSVLEHKFTNSEILMSESSRTSSTVEECENLVSSEKEEKKRRRVSNGLCSGNGTTSSSTNNSDEFRTSQFRHY